MEGMGSFLVAFVLFGLLAAWLFLHVSPLVGVLVGAFALIGVVFASSS